MIIEVEELQLEEESSRESLTTAKRRVVELCGFVSSVPKLFDSETVLRITLQVESCANCNQSFCLRVVNRRHGTRTSVDLKERL